MHPSWDDPPSSRISEPTVRIHVGASLCVQAPAVAMPETVAAGVVLIGMALFEGQVSRDPTGTLVAWTI